MANIPNSAPSVLDEKILDKKSNYLYSVLKFKNSMPRLVGTASLQSQLYPADIDMLCVLETKPKGFNETQRQFKKIFDKIKSTPNLFFVEFKLQNKEKDDKYKFFNLDDVNSDFFAKHYNSSKIDICKIDLLQYLDNKFQDVSCIYFFNKDVVDMNKYTNELLNDQKEKFDEGKYYKSLKRFMVASKLQSPPNLNVIIGITNFFNSYVGKVYQLNNFISACMTYIDKYGFDDRVRMFLSNIGLKGLDKTGLEAISKDYDKLYNTEALKFYKHFRIPVGKLLPFQGKRMVGGNWADSFFKGLTAPFALAAKIPIPGLQQIGEVGTKAFNAIGAPTFF